jgi:dTMP kinase
VSRLITFEGPEGAGKTTQVDLLRAALAHRSPVVTREPGGTPLGERIRSLLLFGPARISREAETLLFLAARAQLVAEVVRPALAAGRIVIADRYHDSTLAYQGGGRGAATCWPDWLPRPDRTFLLLLPAAAGLERARRSGRAADRLEREAPAFHEAVVEAYERLAAAEPGRFVRLDATRPASELHADVMAALEPLLGPEPGRRGGPPRGSGRGTPP